MHIFLTGPRQIGKSTIIQKVVNELTNNFAIKVGGFKTYLGINDDLNIFISHFNENKYYTKANMIGIRNNTSATPIIKTFNNLGVNLLINSNQSDLICMDELGFLEQDANQFTNQVYELINKDTPIIGVIKEQPISWLKELKAHSNVEVITINLENRNEIFMDIYYKILRNLRGI